jgi:hypothetical protein
MLICERLIAGKQLALDTKWHEHSGGSSSGWESGFWHPLLVRRREEVQAYERIYCNLLSSSCVNPRQVLRSGVISQSPSFG